MKKTVMKYRYFILVLLIEIVLLAGLLFYSVAATRADIERVEALKELCEKLYLTDLAIWTEARYTRHPSQTDLFSAFLDCPSCPEHFPAGSIVAVPLHLRAPQEVGY